MTMKLKNLFAAFSAAFTIIGSIIGAGFITGSELVRFFPSSNFSPFILLSFALFFLYFSILLYCGKKYGGFYGVLSAVFKKYAKAVKIIFVICNLLICATMLAGIDSLFYQTFNVSKYFSVFSLVILIIVFFVGRNGVDGIKRINSFLVPSVLVFLFVFALLSKGGEYTFYKQSEIKSVCLVFLYVGLNAFLSTPVICDLGKTVGFIAPSCLASLIISTCAFFILSVILRLGANAINSDMPLLYAVSVKGSIPEKAFSLVCLAGILTTLFSSFYPLHRVADKFKNKELIRVLTCIGVFVFARIGLKRIIDNAYPFFGFLGIVFEIILITTLIIDRLKNRSARKRSDIRSRKT